MQDSPIRWVLYCLEINTVLSLVSHMSRTQHSPLPYTRNVDELFTTGAKRKELNHCFHHSYTPEDTIPKIVGNLNMNYNFTVLLDRMIFHVDMAVVGKKAHWCGTWCVRRS